LTQSFVRQMVAKGSASCGIASVTCVLADIWSLRRVAVLRCINCGRCRAWLRALSREGCGRRGSCSYRVAGQWKRKRERAESPHKAPRRIGTPFSKYYLRLAVLFVLVHVVVRVWYWLSS
jgi:hypothetical protein